MTSESESGSDRSRLAGVRLGAQDRLDVPERVPGYYTRSVTKRCVPPAEPVAAAVWKHLDESMRDVVVRKVALQKTFHEPWLALLAVDFGGTIQVHVESLQRRVRLVSAVALIVGLFLAAVAASAFDVAPSHAFAVAIAFPLTVFAAATFGFAMNVSGLQRYVDRQRAIALHGGLDALTTPEDASAALGEH